MDSVFTMLWWRQILVIFLGEKGKNRTIWRDRVVQERLFLIGGGGLDGTFLSTKPQNLEITRVIGANLVSVSS